MFLNKKFILSPLKGGIILSFFTIIIFLFIYIFFRHKNYFYVSIFSNAFIIPLFYAIFSITISFLRIKNYSKDSFLYFFIWIFLILCIGSIISLIIIFLFFNFIDTQAENLFKKGIFLYWFNHNKIEMIKIYGLKSYNYRIKEIENNNLFNIWNFIFYEIFFFLYYLILSLIITFFLKKKNI